MNSFFYLHAACRVWEFKPHSHLLSVCVQPEAISGSSRMKGGRTTKILLEVILPTAQVAAFTGAKKTPNYCFTIIIRQLA